MTPGIVFSNQPLSRYLAARSAGTVRFTGLRRPVMTPGIVFSKIEKANIAGWALALKTLATLFALVTVGN
ncbi:hypothetical protein [Mycolicibacterium aubagnense]|uniref:hypothetical protein n=1 Tax=Mycolicibacterium aubagnense TaxID=319707 RepID=UPI0010FEABBC|nr:hypothetical protein [Mycolicibacterium aubagnense]